MIKLKKEVNKTQLFKELTEIGKKRYEFTCEPNEDLKVFLDGAESLFKLLRLGAVVGQSEQLKCLMDDDKPNCDCELNHCLKKGW